MGIAGSTATDTVVGIAVDLGIAFLVALSPAILAYGFVLVAADVQKLRHDVRDGEQRIVEAWVRSIRLKSAHSRYAFDGRVATIVARVPVKHPGNFEGSDI